MKDPKDKTTADLITKRGRGRPPKEDALSMAERSKAYRERKAAAGEPVRISPVQYAEVVAERDALRIQVRELRAQLRAKSRQ